jgi:hypothetical protein
MVDAGTVVGPAHEGDVVEEHHGAWNLREEEGAGVGRRKEDT